MSGQTFGLALIRFLHNLFTALWMGGMMVTWFSLRPTAKAVLGDEMAFRKLMRAFQQRQGRIVYYSMAGLVITGLLMARRSPDFSRLFSFDNAYAVTLSLKHLVVLAMIAISLYRSLVLGRGQPDPGAKPGAGGKPGPAGAGQPGAGGKPGAGQMPDRQKMARMQALSLRLLQINAWLAVLVLFLSGLLTALGTAAP